jgi:hypothetical protein
MGLEGMTYTGELRDDVLGLIMILESVPGTPLWDLVVACRIVVQRPRGVLAL